MKFNFLKFAAKRPAETVFTLIIGGILASAAYNTATTTPEQREQQKEQRIQEGRQRIMNSSEQHRVNHCLIQGQNEAALLKDGKINEHRTECLEEFKVPTTSPAYPRYLK